MADFDITKAAAKAYQFSWGERRYLVKLAGVPFLLKTVCYMLAFSYGIEDNYIRLTLCLLPALFTEGWMLSHYVRLILLGQRWPFKPTGDFQKDLPVLRTRARGVMGGLLVYVLINMVLGILLTLVFQLMPAPGQDPATLPASTGYLFMMLLALGFWGFRLTWLYIPYAVNLDAKYFLRVLRGPFVSLSMISTWLMCIMPFFLFMQVIGGLIHGVLKGTMGDTVASFLFIIMIMAVDTLKNIVATAGITYGLQEVFAKDKAGRTP